MSMNNAEDRKVNFTKKQESSMIQTSNGNKQKQMVRVTNRCGRSVLGCSRQDRCKSHNADTPSVG